jgi:hypothetical protein
MDRTQLAQIAENLHVVPSLNYPNIDNQHDLEAQSNFLTIFLEAIWKTRLEPLDTFAFRVSVEAMRILHPTVPERHLLYKLDDLLCKQHTLLDCDQ